MLGSASRWSCYICNGDQDLKSIFFPQMLFLIWIDVWVIWVKKNSKRFSSPSARAGVISVSRRWTGLQLWLLFHLTPPFVGSGRCMPFTYSRIMTMCAFQLSKAVLFFPWLFVIGNVFPEDSMCVCIVFQLRLYEAVMAGCQINGTLGIF